MNSSCQERVSSGYHPTFKPKTGSPMFESVIDLLLTRGSGADDAGMVTAVFASAPSQMSLGYTSQILLRLAGYETPVVRVAACLKLRDLLADDRYQNQEAQESIAKELGIKDRDLARWRKQYKEFLGGDYTLPRYGSTGEAPPTVTSLAKTLAGLSLCENDNALDVSQMFAPLNHEP